MEIKLIQRTYALQSWVFQKNSLCTVGNIIQFLKPTISLEKKWKPCFLHPTDERISLVYMNCCFYLFNLNK